MPKPAEKTVSSTYPLEDLKAPTSLDLFKSDFSNTLRVSDTNGPAFFVQAPDGSKVEILRQVYMDFPARTKFIGFYIHRPVPPSSDFKAEKTAAACFELLKANAIQGSFNGMEKQGGVMGGQSGQMTTAKDLTFSGRVLIYHEEYLSIPQKAAILDAYQKRNMDVQFYGDEYLGTQLIAWHQKHDSKVDGTLTTETGGRAK
jgi:hypothetical protein